MVTENKKKSNFEKFKWWVTPLNLLLIAGFVTIIDLATGTPPGSIEWAYWPAIGLLLIYILNLAVVRKPELAWFVGPAFFLLISVFLLILDIAYEPNTGFLNLDWATIPIGALLIFGTIIPILVLLGKRKKTPKMRFEEFEEKMETNKETS